MIDADEVTVRATFCAIGVVAGILIGIVMTLALAPQAPTFKQGACAIADGKVSCPWATRQGAVIHLYGVEADYQYDSTNAEAERRQ